MQVPRIWRCLLQACGISDQLAGESWRALAKARWSEASAFRQALLLFEERPAHLQDPDSVLAWMTAHAQPQHLVHVLECLVQERRLPRQKATAIEERIFCTMTKDDGWR